MKRIVCIAVAMMLCSCSRQTKVGDWYEVVKTRERVKIEMIGTLDQVKAYADTFYTRKARKNMESFRGTSVLDFMGVAEVKEQFGAELQLDEARYRDYQDRKDHAFFLHYEGEHNEGVMFGPVEMLEKDYRRVE